MPQRDDAKDPGDEEMLPDNGTRTVRKWRSMRPATYCKGSAKVTPVMPDECWRKARPDAGMPPPVEGPVRVRRLNGGRIAWRGLRQPDRDDQCVALWVPDGVPTIRGVIFHLHRASEAARTDFHAVGRAMCFAVYGALVRWTNFEKVLPDQLAKLAGHLGHPEAADAPWVAIGGSRNAAALCSFILQDRRRDRVLCLLTNGGPGVSADLTDRRTMNSFRGLPVLSVNGTEDPYVGGLAWFQTAYPRMAAKRLPWSCAPDWGGGHAGLTNGAMYWPFVQAVMARRRPPGMASHTGKTRLKPFMRVAGIRLGPIDWNQPESAEPALPDVAEGHTVWLPDAATAAVWRAYSTRRPIGRLDILSRKRGGKTTLTMEGVRSRSVSEVRYLDGDVLLGSSARQPFRLSVVIPRSGIHAVHAECLDRRSQLLGRTRPVLIAGGVVVDQSAGCRAAAGAGERLMSRRMG